MADRGTSELDLTACEKEPIHIPGSIQPHGVLLALDSSMLVRRFAGDVAALPGADGDPIGHHLSDRLDTSGIELDWEEDQATYVGTTAGWDMFAHRSGEELIVELEPAPVKRMSGAEVLRDLLPAVGAIGTAAGLAEACSVAADAVRMITGFDRVMIYRFLEDETGKVVAESRADDVASFLNHRYPATDIPRQARALYVRNPIRVIADVNYTPAPIVGGDRPLDLSGSLLRSVSPVHIQYLKNMDVGASASVSLIRDGTLWGLIACHHRTARAIPHEEREMCRRVAIALDHALVRLEEENSQREALILTRRREELLPLIAAAETMTTGMRSNIDELKRLVSADGIALQLDSDISCSGVTPPQPALSELARWVVNQPSQQLVTNHLSELYPPAAEWAAAASGLMSTIVSRLPLIAIMWFRAEEVETVNWAGNPHKPAEPGEVAGQLTPRKSFEIWAETVRGRSRSWRPNEQDGARRVSSGLAEIGRQKALTELNRQLTIEVAEKDLLMREVHHRVQNSLQLVTSMLQLQERELGEEGAREQLELARDRVLSVALLHRRLWRSEDLQNINLETFFGELLEGLARTWDEQWQKQVRLDVAPVRVPAHDALLIALVVSELLTNAVKHAYRGAPGPLTVTAREAGKDRVTISVADRGVGTTGEANPDSFGSRLVQRLVSKMGGELSYRANNPGTEISLTVPTGSIE